MKKLLLCLAMTLAAMVWANPQTAGAGEPIKRSNKTASQLPAAFQAMNADHSQILTPKQSKQIRGKWYINIPLPVQGGAISVQGVGGPFQLNLLTESAHTPGRLIGWRVRVGH